MKPKKRIARRIAALLLAACLLLAAGCGKKEGPEESGPKLGYAEGVTVVNDPDALQKAVDAMYAQASQPGITLEYQGIANSDDGENFTCYIANAAENGYDMYVQIFADSELTDQLLLTGLLRPGTALREITLDHALDSGAHTAYAAFTQVEEDLETIHAQVFVTIDFVVA